MSVAGTLLIKMRRSQTAATGRTRMLAMKRPEFKEIFMPAESGAKATALQALRDA
jgi:hypothetical protein